MYSVLRLGARALLMAGAVGLAACGGGDGNGGGGGGTTTSFSGIVSPDDGSPSGSIFLVVQTANPAPPAPTGPAVRDPVNVTGTLKFGASTTSLTGTYDPDQDIIAVTGGGYDFGGGFDGNNRLEGFWTGPGGSTGTFVTTNGTNAVVYCGTYAADDQSDSGAFSFVITGNQLLGEAVSDQGGGTIPLDGSVSGNNITIQTPGGGSALATGTISGNSVSGTYDDGQGSTGTWSGGVCP